MATTGTALTAIKSLLRQHSRIQRDIAAAHQMLSAIDKALKAFDPADVQRAHAAVTEEIINKHLNRIEESKAIALKSAAVVQDVAEQNRGWDMAYVQDNIVDVIATEMNLSTAEHQSLARYVHYSVFNESNDMLQHRIDTMKGFPLSIGTEARIRTLSRLMALRNPQAQESGQ